MRGGKSTETKEKMKKDTDKLIKEAKGWVAFATKLATSTKPTDPARDARVRKIAPKSKKDEHNEKVDEVLSYIKTDFDSNSQLSAFKGEKMSLALSDAHEKIKNMKADDPSQQALRAQATLTFLAWYENIKDGKKIAYGGPDHSRSAQEGRLSENIANLKSFSECCKELDNPENKEAYSDSAKKLQELGDKLKLSDPVTSQRMRDMRNIILGIIAVAVIIAVVALALYFTGGLAAVPLVAMAMHTGLAPIIAAGPAILAGLQGAFLSAGAFLSTTAGIATAGGAVLAAVTVLEVAADREARSPAAQMKTALEGLESTVQQKKAQDAQQITSADKKDLDTGPPKL